MIKHRILKTFLCAALAGFAMTAGGTAHAGKWSLAGPAHPVNDINRYTPLPDTYPNGVSTRSAITAQFVDVWDGSSAGRSIARNCIAFWNVAGTTCGQWADSGAQHMGHAEIQPAKTWTEGGVLHGWIAADDVHFAYVEVGTDDPQQKFMGVTFYW